MNNAQRVNFMHFVQVCKLAKMTTISFLISIPAKNQTFFWYFYSENNHSMNIVLLFLKKATKVINILVQIKQRRYQ